ncbi:MAG: PQQ-binding-like beta-propeller repeat protein, partial [Phycisphaerae bacterium]
MRRALWQIVAIVALSVSVSSANDWSTWRGPEQCGVSREPAPVKTWSEEGENLLWRSNMGGRTTPAYLDGRLFMIAPDGVDETLREKVVSLDAKTGKEIWSHSFNVFHTDIVENRLGWTSVAVDAETKNIYAHGTGGELFCFSWDGKIRWKRSLTEEYGRESGYGGRLHTPVIDEDRVIISFTYILSTWGSGKKKAGHRYLAFDKNTGDLIWIGQPGGKPFDTTYSTPIVTVINGRRLLIGGNADGHIYAMEARTGRKVWSYHLTLRGGINTSVVSDGKYVYACHAKENPDSSVMGRVVCIDGSLEGEITQDGELWRADGIKAGFSSPALANGRVYVVTNTADLVALDAKTGERYWEHNLGRVMKGSPVVTADGVIYAGEVNGQFSIVKDAGDHAEVLDSHVFTRPDGLVVEFNGSVSIGDGRVYFMTTDHTYCLGTAGGPVDKPVPALGSEKPADKKRPKTLMITPAEVTLQPGESTELTWHIIDANGVKIDSGSSGAVWGVNGVHGMVDTSGKFMADAKAGFSAGTVTAKVGGLEGAGRVRISPPLPINENFDSMTMDSPPAGWVGLDANVKVMELAGERVLCKLAKSPSAKYSRMRSFSGPSIPTGYTV